MQVYSKTLMLGTAQWGWTVPKNEAFRLLDAWIKAGYRHIDSATNYPINRNPADFRAAEKILQEYILVHGLHDLRLTMKIGSLDNLRSPDVNLAPSFIQMMSEEYLRLFGTNLTCLMFHWDNRNQEAAIQQSLEALQQMQQAHGIVPGISGIAHPEVYATLNASIGLAFEIQLKNNVLHSDFDKYAPLRSSIPKAEPHRFFAYGLNAGGVKLEPPYPAQSTFLARGGQPENAAPILEKIKAALSGWNTAHVRPPLKTMNQVGMVYSAWHPGLQGLLLGVSSLNQLQESLDFWRNFEVFDYSDVFSALKKILLPTQAPHKP